MLKISRALGALTAFAMAGAWQPVAAQAVKSTLKPTAGGTTPVLIQRAAARNPRKLAVIPLAALPDLSPEQMAIANRVALGKMPCELAAHVLVKPDARGTGRFVLELGKEKYSMVPVPTLTGAIRLEDEAAGVVWLQLSNKSMLMSHKHGKRLADACASAEQLTVAKELERNPPPSLLDAPPLSQALAQSPAAEAEAAAAAAAEAAPAAPEVSVAADGAAK